MQTLARISTMVMRKVRLEGIKPLRPSSQCSARLPAWLDELRYCLLMVPGPLQALSG
jgi:hypothetical protein